MPPFPDAQGRGGQWYRPGGTRFPAAREFLAALALPPHRGGLRAVRGGSCRLATGRLGVRVEAPGRPVRMPVARARLAGAGPRVAEPPPTQRHAGTPRGRWGRPCHDLLRLRVAARTPGPTHDRGFTVVGVVGGEQNGVVLAALPSFPLQPGAPGCRHLRGPLALQATVRVILLTQLGWAIQVPPEGPDPVHDPVNQ